MPISVRAYLHRIAIVYRPITLEELISVVNMPEALSDKPKLLESIIGLCGSFLTIREGTIYFVHQSAKDYLLINASDKIFPSGKEAAHYIASQDRSRSRRRYNETSTSYVHQDIQSSRLSRQIRTHYRLLVTHVFIGFVIFVTRFPARILHKAPTSRMVVRSTSSSETNFCTGWRPLAFVKACRRACFRWRSSTL